MPVNADADELVRQVNSHTGDNLSVLGMLLPSGLTGHRPPPEVQAVVLSVTARAYALHCETAGAI
ncbi:hypothetical protein ABN034_24245 [Actinopolymorpha sp. B11F2]|uniref:hypothetical protein n=1 Tax=Actinopolymorpha sp. B11F2 TaxID=3160862 RepID=UPI0032E471DD